VGPLPSSDLQAPPPYESRLYLLYNLTAPEGLVTHGVRDFIVKYMGGLPIVGSARRTFDSFVGQTIDLKVLGTRSALDSMETELLREYENRRLWAWRLVERGEWTTMPDNGQFVILPSSRRATRGPDSDDAHDNKSEGTSSSNSSGSGGAK
jgi:hypothetical protein